MGQALSCVGSLASFLALPLLVLAERGSPAQAGLAASCNFAASLLTSLPGGVLVDRYSRRATMLISNLVRSGSMVVLAVATSAHRASLPLILSVACVEGGLGSLFAPAEVAALRRIVPDTQLGPALAANQARTAAAALAGPALGGLLFGISHALPFALNAASYAVSSVCVLLVRTPLAAPTLERSQVTLRDLGGGLRFLAGDPFLRFTMLSDPTTNFAFSGILVGLIVSETRLGHSGFTTGMVIAMAGAGALVGSGVASRVAPRVSPRRAILVVAWSSTLLVPALAGTRSTLAIGATLGLLSVLSPIETVVVGAFRMLLTPDQLQGRVQSAAGLLSTCATPLGPVAAGFLLSAAGRSAMFLAFAGLLGAVALMAVFSRGLRSLPAASQATTGADPSQHRAAPLVSAPGLGSMAPEGLEDEQEG